MGFIDEIKAKAKTCKKTIVLPETEDIRTYEAAEAVLKEGTANLILVGSEEEIAKNKGDFDISGATIVDPATSEKTEGYIAKLVELRQKKGMTEEQARELLLTNYLYYGVMMVKMKDADGMVSGACHSTADTLRPCLQILKTKPGTKLVSAFFVIVVPDCDMGADGTFIFADSGLEQNPDPEKLAAIALSSADSFRLLTGKEPIVAMLSHSTKGSAKHPDVDKVVEATRIAKENAPEGLQLEMCIRDRCRKEEEANSMKKTIQVNGENGKELEWLSPEEIIKREPILNPKAFCGGVYCKDGGNLNPFLLVNAYICLLYTSRCV